MGGPMALNLARNGFALVAHDIDPAKLTPLRAVGAQVADSPERQQRIEQIARAYAQGVYEMDAEATAGKLIDDGLKFR